MKKGEEARLAEKEVELKREASKPRATQRGALGQVSPVGVLKQLGFYVPFQLSHRMQVAQDGHDIKQGLEVLIKGDDSGRLCAHHTSSRWAAILPGGRFWWCICVTTTGADEETAGVSLLCTSV